MNIAEREIDLIEKAAKRAGMVILLNHGAASCVYSEGCNGVTQEHLMAFAREIALHCATALYQPNLEDAQGEIRALRATEAGLRGRLAQVEAEHAALLKAISDAEPVAWIVEGQTLGGGVSQYLAWKKSGAGQVPAPLRTDPTPLYTLNGIKE